MIKMDGKILRMMMSDQDEKNGTKNNNIHQASSKSSHDSLSPNGQKQASKRQKTDHKDIDNGHGSSKEDNKEEKEKQSQDSDENEDGPTHDSYYVYLDPDLLNEFMNVTGLQPMEEGTAFFLLMTFPFMEHEWDLVGYVLDEVFGCDDDDDDDDEEDST